MNTQGGGHPTQVSVTPYDGPTPEPGAPRNLTPTSGDRQVTLSWEAPSHTGTSAITRYEYQYRTASGTFGDTWTTVTGTGTTVTGLTGATTYFFRVRAVNTQGAGTPSSEIETTVYAGSTAEPGAPRNLTPTSGDRQVTLSWEAPSAGASAITRYEYQYRTASGTFGNTWTEVSNWENALKVTIDSLIAGTTYHFQVRAVNAQGAGIPSDASLTLDDGIINPETVCSDPATTDSALPGKGTVDNPFALCSPAHLSLIGDTGTNAAYTLSASYVMGQDIDLNNKSFTPIAGVFTGTLDGRDRKIMNLKIKVSGHGALFVELGSGGSIKNLGIEEFDVTGSRRVGSLVATSSGTITNCYAVDSDKATDLSGGANSDSVGGLVGSQKGGSITSSYAAGNPDGGSGNDNIGGLVGYQKGGSITSSYATGGPHGGEGNDYVGGLVGYQVSGGSVISSYATGSPHGGEGNDDVGGLVGNQFGGSVISSYATGSPHGGEDNDDVGGLVGNQFGDITFSYATGNPKGGSDVDKVGGLVGYQGNGSVISSYGFGTVVNGETLNTHGASPSGVTSASGLTATNSGTSNTNQWSVDAWDFGTSSQAPALKYVDSLNSDSTTAYTCTSNTAFLPSIDITCGTTLLPKQPGRLCIDSTDSVLSGTGVVNDPFVLCSPAHLSLIGDTGTNATYTLSANYVMGRDIDLNNEPFTPIAGVFTGTLDGRDKKIMNLTINVSGHAALFLELGSGGSIKNLGIKEFDVTGSGRVGSLVAISYGTITRCYAVDLDEATDVSGGANSDFVGGLVGFQGGRLTSSYATGNPDGGSGNDKVGGLVGRLSSTGSLTSSYATGSPDGGDNNDHVGGLVGSQASGGTILSSYATGNPEGRSGSDYIGGLVGYQGSGSITSSYAMGSPNGGEDGDRVGGLVGYQVSGGTILSSYAMGNPNGGENQDLVGGLVGWKDGDIASSYATGNPDGGADYDHVSGLVGYQVSGSITSSYGFGTTVNGETSNTHGDPPSSPSDVTSASGLTQANSGSSDANKWSNDAWDFGTSSQAPALKYVDSYTLGDHDDDANTPETYAYTCTSNTAFLPSIDITCGTTLLPKQLDRLCSESTDSSLSGTGTVSDPFVLCSPAHLRLIGTDAAYTLSANYVMGQDIDLNNKSFTPIAGVFTGTLDGRNKKIMNLKIKVSGYAALFLKLGLGGSIKNLGIEEFDVTGSEQVGSLVATSSGIIANCYAVDSDEATDVSGGVSYVNYVGGLVGHQYDGGSITSSYATGNPVGGGGNADTVGGLVGYQNIGGSITSSYATGSPDGGGGHSDNVGGLVGYQHGGTITSSYATGNPDGRGGIDYLGGLVGYQASGGSITSSYATGSPDGGDNDDFVGGLVGYQYSGTITSSYATGHPKGESGDDDVGGLVGFQYGGTITSSYATGNPKGESGDDYVGGLVGYQASGGTITSSYATGSPEGGKDMDYLGGLVGYQASGGTITSSYATGNPKGGEGSNDSVGGLVGYQYGGTTTSSYATGNPDGGGGNVDTVGSLVGYQYSGTITSSYATGNPKGGEGSNDSVGSLVGYQVSGRITSSYGFGTTVNGENSNTHGAPPSDVSSASGLTQKNSGSSDTNKWSTDAWDFRTSSQAPALKYVDSYTLGDHDNDVYTCTSNTAFLPPVRITCGTTLLPNQR